MSSLFLRTLRDDPADAEVPSHRLLVRAGYVRRNVAGIYTWLPLGKRVLDKVASIVREEMDGIGGQEVLFPALLPKEPYEATGRWTEYGDEIFRLVDRKGADYLLGPTHEEMFTLLVKGEYSSYRDLPVVLYQVQTKYRDEARPRSGILRAREFVMKDSYSFDLTDEALGQSYAAHRAAYVRMFDRMGLTYRIVQATAGAMGGSHSEEYLAPTPSGEDTYVLCGACGYAANAEAVPSVVGDVPDVQHGPVELIHTPDSATIEALATRLGVEASATLKTILVTVDGDIVAVAVPGDREVDITRLEAHVAPARVELLSEAAFADSDVLVKGYVGPQGLAGTAFRLIADPRVAVGTAWIAGGNQVDYHARNVVAGRDFTVDEYVDVASMLEGDPCPTCGSPLATDRGLELGHIFQLGRKYAAALGLDVDGPDGGPVTVTMGSYGVGISRAVAAIVEQSHDDRGIIWPASVSPYDVHVTGVGTKGQAEAAAELAGRLAAAGLDVLLDDRDASAGVKFADADLVGVPTIVVVGRDYADGLVEVKDRLSGERRSVNIDEVLATLTT